MPKLTDIEIEATITQSHANIAAVMAVTSSERVIDPCIARELRACFTAGRDHGQALVLARAAEFVTVVNVEHEALGRAVATVLAWVGSRKGRSWSVGSDYAVGYLSKELDEPLTNGDVYQFVYGTETRSAIVALAQWCTEHDAKPEPRRDTEPAPPLPLESDSRIAVADECPATEPNL